MNLPSSVVVTVFIVAVVWTAVAYQPGQAWAYTPALAEHNDADKKTATANADSSPAAGNLTSDPLSVVSGVNRGANTVAEKHGAAATLKSFERFQLEGVSGTVNLSGIDQLWLDFGSRYDLHNRLTGTHISSYVLYRNLNEDFSRADVTIGYNQADIRGAAEVTASVPAGRYDILLEAGKHNQSALASSWSDIDHNRPIEAILEEHSLNTSGQVVASAIYVLYR